MTKLARILLIIFSFVMIDIVRLLCKALIITAPFRFSVIGCGGNFVQLGMKIIIIDGRHRLLTLN